MIVINSKIREGIEIEQEIKERKQHNQKKKEEKL